MSEPLSALQNRLFNSGLFTLAPAIAADVTAWLEYLPEEGLVAVTEFFRDDLNLRQWHTTITLSQFARQQLTSIVLEAPILLNIASSLQTTWQKANYQASFEAWLADTNDEASFDRGIRLWRNAMMVRSIWRDLNRIAETLDITAELTHFADVAIEQTLNYHYPRLAEERGEPCNDAGEPMPMLVLGMGKLGAYELNLSSDIDLIFAYPESGETVITQPKPGRKPISNQEFFSFLGQKLIKTLDKPMAEGFVFRVDMRLRPYGQSGALVSNFDALEAYYLTQGRDWERYAMVKARVVACSKHPQAAAIEHELMAMLNSFTYRKYVDFTAIEALRDLKARIRQEVKRRRLHNNVKLGEGGIREVEFIIQALQLIRGGRDTQLKTPSLVKAKDALVELGAIPSDTAEQLMAAYLFLRNAEHAIQAWQDKQTQELPSQPDAQQALATAMGFADWESFKRVLTHHMSFVSQEFGGIIADKEPTRDQAISQRWQSLWAETDETVLEPLLANKGFSDAELAARTLTAIHHAPQVLAGDKIGADRLNRFMPLLISQLSHRQSPGQTLHRLQPLILAIARRSAYLLLLIETPAALEQLLVLSEASPWIPEQLAKHPALLDELMSPSTLYQIPSRNELNAELQQLMLRIEQDDLEQQMEAMRYFKQAHSLRVAACEVTGKLPLMKVSDYLTELAEVILQFALTIAWQQMTSKHGLPGGQDDDQPHFAIIGYGKLGGIELGHSSDLDLVFIHDADSQQESQAEPGQKSLDNQTFYTRLGQKVIHLLSTKMPSGILYEVDMRLRPSGNSGMLVSTLKAFERYQLNDAWTWEHQALVRARAIAGHSGVITAFNDVRQTILQQIREQSKLAKEVVDMRQKMRDNLGTSKEEKSSGLFHIKQDAGGIVDIEFMVQYLVLAYSHQHPSLTHWSDNIRILETAEQCQLLTSEQVATLISHYKTLRAQTHKLALQQQSSKVATETFDTTRQDIESLWQQLLLE